MQRQRVFEQRDKLGAERQEELRKAAVKFEEEQRGKLLEAVPEWKDPEKLSAGLRDLTAEARKIGFSDQELSSVVDHRLLLVLRDAVAYRKLQAAKPKVENRITEVVTPVAPGAAGTQSAPKTELTKAKERVRQIENRALNKLRKELSRRQGDEGATQQQQIEAE